MTSADIELFGNSYTIQELKQRVADMSTVAGVRPLTLAEGTEKGVLAVDVRTGSGLEYTVIPDRGMNICNFRYRGVPLDWSSGTGVTSPFSYEAQNWNWLRSFNGGLLHTCGLDNVGEPCMDEDKNYGGHGRISNTPAKEVAWRTNTDCVPHTVEVSGKCRSVAAIEESVLLERNIVSTMGGTQIVITDRITNCGCSRTPVFLLYHCNFGFPLLSEDAELTIPATEGVDGAGEAVTDMTKLEPPSDSDDEAVFHPLITDDEPQVSLFNPKLGEGGLGVYLKYNRAELPHLTVWKFFQKRSYVMGIEPGTCRVGGRDIERREDRAIFLDPDESMSITLEIGILTSASS